MNTSTVGVEIGTTIMEVTPDLAQLWLGRNSRNRRVKMEQVVAWQREMEEGRWQLNGEAIKLAGPLLAPTMLLDGQNRLTAILRSRVTVRMLVVYGLPVDSQLTMDSGSKRTAADDLTILGIKNSSSIAAAAALSLRFSDGYLNGYGSSVANSRILEWVEDHPEIELSATVAAKYAIKADATKTLVTYTHWQFARIDLDAATAFWRDASEKVQLVKGDPILALTNRLASARRSRERVSPGVAVAATFRVWNARRQGQTLRSITLSGPVDAFPRLR